MNHLSCFSVEPTLTGSRASEAVILSIFVYFYGFFELKKKYDAELTGHSANQPHSSQALRNCAQIFWEHCSY